MSLGGRCLRGWEAWWGVGGSLHLDLEQDMVEPGRRGSGSKYQGGRPLQRLEQDRAVSFIGGPRPGCLCPRVGTACAHSTPPPASHVGETKHGMMKFREDRSLLGLGLPTGGFHDRYFILNSSCLRLYKEVRVRDPARSWPAVGTRTHACSVTQAPVSPWA